ncbi:haloacid dehalogenase [Pseudoalteromonas sp. SCSIO_11900]|uniref:HAD family hydrolase n=1 Tax=Pseudoalteromonas sp. SCSIO_11900 TaxID=1461766 RepID=UPI0004501EA9|nr:HAD hydrolase-like protein [Pseudoalteromonas sp. SCSIO_11900]EWS98583.1 haloacid dehalogenase [Pseudoalteromonas sp. SCSIO_11900]
MRIFDQYDLIIFDCDGVLLDSNNMKVSAMNAALTLSNCYTNQQVESLTKQFKNNFGRSRFYHVDSFVDPLLLDIEKKSDLKTFLLNSYAEQVNSLYLTVPEAVGIKPLLRLLSSKALYVASGSEQEQLKVTLERRGFSEFFKGILGSPETKVDNINNILNGVKYNKAVMVGDAVADYEAALENGIDFVFYSPLSNVKDQMIKLSEKNHFKVIDNYEGQICL